MSVDKHKTSKARIIGIGLSLVGLVLSGIQSLPYLFGSEDHLLAGLCGSGTCLNLHDSPWAVFPPTVSELSGWTYRIPVAILGLWHFCFQACWFIVVGIPTSNRARCFAVPLLESMLGCIASSGLLGVMFVSKTFCLLCVSTHLINILLSTAVFFTWTNLDRIAQSASSTSHPSLPRVWFFFIVTICLALVLLPAGMTAEEEFQHLLDHYLREEVVRIAVDADDPRLPARDAMSSRIVVFMDLECPPCQEFNQSIHEFIIPSFDGRLEVVYKHFPLCRDCNPELAHVHPFACERAYLAEAARMQGGMGAFSAFQACLESMSTALSANDVESLAQRTGLDLSQLEKDRNGPRVRALVTRDIQQGMLLGVRGTPTIFLNGKKVPPLLARRKDFWNLMSKQDMNLIGRPE